VKWDDGVEMEDEKETLEKNGISKEKKQVRGSVEEGEEFSSSAFDDGHLVPQTRR